MFGVLNVSGSIKLLLLYVTFIFNFIHS